MASRGTAKVLDDKKQDSLLSKIEVTVAFFGTRGLIRTSARFLGIPFPIATLLAGIVSESIKKILRDEDNKNALSSRTKLDIPEITGDIMKWLIYDFLIASFVKSSLSDKVLAGFAFGAISAIIGSITREYLRYNDVEKTKGQSFISMSKSFLNIN